MKQQKHSFSGVRDFFTLSIIISTLGYFVDTFDIVIFSLVRVPSLTELGFTGDALTQKGIFLFNMQLGGMLVGGILWGCIGDRRGRSSALIFSILCYALANIANGFVDTIESYAICRFISGIGLAGEMGAAVTLVMESVPGKRRGLGALLVTFVGSLGALTAAAIGGLLYWRYLYFLGGGMGLLLLLARAGIQESQMFVASKAKDASRGNFLDFFKTPRMFRQFMGCFLIGMPHYLVFGVLITLSPEITRAMGMSETVSVPLLLMVYAACLSCGDAFSTLFSQFIQSRKKVVVLFVTAVCGVLSALYFSNVQSATAFYMIFGGLGFFAGYFMLVPIIAAETFGINLRVTATSGITNCVRASAILMNIAVGQLKFMGIITATQIVGFTVMALTLMAALSLKETFHKDMDFFD